jgi:thioesterase domain-containing protein
VFFFTGAGGVALVFESLARNLNTSLSLYGVQMRGLETRALPELSVGHAARRFIAELPKLQPSGPYLLFGRSYGGLVAHDIACRLEAAGETVALLGLMDAYLAPAVVDRQRHDPMRPGQSN